LGNSKLDQGHWQFLRAGTLGSAFRRCDLLILRT
jgi:hypothetical protein